MTLSDAFAELPGLIERAMAGDRRAEKELNFAERYGGPTPYKGVNYAVQAKRGAEMMAQVDNDFSRMTGIPIVESELIDEGKILVVAPPFGGSHVLYVGVGDPPLLYGWDAIKHIARQAWDFMTRKPSGNYLLEQAALRKHPLQFREGGSFRPYEDYSKRAP